MQPAKKFVYLDITRWTTCLSDSVCYWKASDHLSTLSNYDQPDDQTGQEAY